MLNTTATSTGARPRPRIWRFVSLLAATLLAWTGALAQDAATGSGTPTVIPAYRQADKVVVITLTGGIDSITAMSVRRRIELAERGGADAIVLDIDSPGGEVGAVLEITNAIKGSSIANTVAWINPDAYSGGAIVALACREIVANSPASMGDAFPVTMAAVPGQSRVGLRGLTPDERTKILPVLLADVTDSARRNGWDEYMVQAVVIDGIELWWVEDKDTGMTMAVNEEEYKMLFGRMPVRGRPLLAGVTGGVQSSPTTPPRRPAPLPGEDAEAEADPAETEPAPAPPRTRRASEAENGQGFLPASEALRDIADEFASAERTDLRLEQASQRPVLTPADAGRFNDLGYLTDGTAPIVMRDDQMRRFGFAIEIIRNDEELTAFFGARELIRVNENWSEKLVRFMTGGIVRGVLIVVMLLALFIEMMSPGLTVPGVIAGGALILLLAPPMLVGMAGWWELAAITIGIVLLAVELFVLPGFGLFGVLGVIALFGGLLGTFVPAGGSLADPGTQEDLLRGATIILLSVITAGIGMYLIGRHFNRFPLLDRLVLGARMDDEDEEGARVDAEMLRAATRQPAAVAEVGAIGVATTTLRPSGTAEFDGRLVDVVADLGYIDSNTPVRVVRVEGFRVVVDTIPEDTA
ncbi:MAG: hypothetical protein LAT64_06675 [Phycisphaerales bacterium]|nr:hypothetical protein [Planctomycetota bacterium]MCH8508439.1 hypothetical protein [Phycisphaerales bacterium]